jgi:hypothetical protein
MATTVTINGVTKTVVSMQLTSAQNERDRLTATLVDPAGNNNRPAIDSEIKVVEDGVTLFGGSIKTPSLSGHEGAKLAVQSRVSALDYNELGDRQIVTVTIAAGTLKAAATLLLAYLPGVAIDSSWTADGPSLPELVYTDVSVDAILSDLSTRSGWIRHINYDKKLKFWSPGTVAAPWNVADGDGNVIGDMSSSITRQDYANQIKVKFSDFARKAYAFLRIPSGNFADGETVTIGSKTYTFKTTLANTDGYVKIGADGPESLLHLAAAINLWGGAGTDYAAATSAHGSVEAYEQTSIMMKCRALAAGASGNSISVAETSTNASWVTEGNVGTGTLTFGADEALTNFTIRNNTGEQASYGIYSKVVEAPNIFDLASANALGDAVLAESIITLETVKYTTKRAGLLPGMTQTIASAKRFINSASFLIVEVTTQWRAGSSVVFREVTAIKGSTFRSAAWQQQYRKWSSGISGGAAQAAWVGSAEPATTLVAYTLGGSRSLYVSPSPAAWTPIAEWVPVKGVTAFSALVRCWAWARNAGITVQIRLTSGTDGVTFGTTVATLSSVTSQTATERTASFTVEVGKYYRLEVQPSAAGEGCGCVGYLETA